LIIPIIIHFIEESFSGLKILDAHSGTGIRSLRLMKELDPTLINYIHACDHNKSAIDLINRNIELNHLDKSKISGKTNPFL